MAQRGKQRSKKSKHWLWTINNYGPDDFAAVDRMKEISTYIVFQEEVGDEKNTPHLQGYVAFINRRELTACKKILPRAHWDEPDGTSFECKHYCTKPESRVEGTQPTEWGTFPLSGGERTKRNWDEAYSLAKTHRRDEIRKDILVPYYGNIRRIEQDNPLEPRDLDATCGIWLYGSSGVGKSTKARWLAGGLPFYRKACNKWWIGYKYQPVVIIDDFDTSHACLSYYVKLWGDKFAFPAEDKGGGLVIRPELVIITSQYTPASIWFNEPESKAAIERRFKLYKIEKDW